MEGKASRKARGGEKRKKVTADGIFEGIGDGLFLLNMEGELISANPAFEIITGYRKSELTGRKIVDIFSMMVRNEDAQRIKEAFSDALKGRPPSYIEFHLSTKGGKEILASSAISFVKDKNGIPVAIIVTLREIADHKRAEEEITRYVNQLLVLHQTSQDIIRAGNDPEMVYVAIHGTTSRLMPAEAFVISLFDVSKNEIESVYLIDRGGRWPPQKVPAGKGLSGRVISTGEATLISDYSPKEFPDVVHFGHPEHVRSILAVPIRLGKRVIGMIATESYSPNAYSEEDRILLEMLGAHAASVLENARLFDELRISEEKYRGLFVNVFDGVYQSTPDGRFLMVNPALARMLGYDSVEELLSVNAQDLYIDPHDKEAIARELEEKGELHAFETVLKRKDGKRVIVFGNARAVRNEQGNISYYEGTLTDITERKKMEERLRQSNLQLEFVNDLMSHDLLNINQVMLGYLDFLNETELTERQKKYVETIIYSTKRCARLIDNVNKIWKSKESPLRTIDIDGCIKEALQQISMYPGKDVNINYDPYPCLVYANDLLVDVLGNLLDNAIKFDASKNVEIDILVSEYGEKCRLSVADRGKGIPDEYKKAIFLRFERLEKGVRGTGLGLHLVKTIVESYDGEIWVEDNTPCGSIFNVVLRKAKN